MKEKIHPVYQEATITCACGEVIHTRSTKKEMHIDICSKCHPLYTGKQRLVDTAGRVERYRIKLSKKESKPAAKAAKAPKAAAKTA